MRRRNAVDAGHWPHAIGRERRPPTRRDEGISAGGCGVPLAIGCPAPPSRVAPTPVAVALFSAHARQRRCFYQCHRIHHIQPTPLRLLPRPRSCATAQFIAHCVLLCPIPTVQKRNWPPPAPAPAPAHSACLHLKPVSNSTKLHPNNLREEGSSSLHCSSGLFVWLTVFIHVSRINATPLKQPKTNLPASPSPDLESTLTGDRRCRWILLRHGKLHLALIFSRIHRHLLAHGRSTKA